MSSKEFYPPTVYAAQLSRLRYGYPLWYPEPADGLEVQLGDVGIIDGGRFRRLFNAISEAGLTPDRRPKDFEPLKLADQHEVVSPEVLGAGIHGSDISKAQSKLPDGSDAWSAKCRDEEGAVLWLKESADLVQITNVLQITRYIKQHHTNWVNFARSMGLNLSPDGIIFVRGYIKVSEWAMATWKVKGPNKAHDGSLTYTPGSGFAFQFTSPESVMHVCKAHYQSSTAPDPMPKNQCIFLQYFKVKFRHFWPDTLLAAAGPSRLPDSPPDDQSSSVPASEAIHHLENEEEGSHDAKSDVARADDIDLEGLFLSEGSRTDRAQYLTKCPSDMMINDRNSGWSSFQYPIPKLLVTTSAGTTIRNRRRDKRLLNTKRVNTRPTYFQRSGDIGSRYDILVVHRRA